MVSIVGAPVRQYLKVTVLFPVCLDNQIVLKYILDTSYHIQLIMNGENLKLIALLSIVVR